MIGFAFTLTRMMINIMIGLTVAAVALALWMCLAMLLLLPGDKRGTRRSMHSASRMATRALSRMI